MTTHDSLPTPGLDIAAPSTILRVSELFFSLQGEGPTAGTPAHFLRLP